MDQVRATKVMNLYETFLEPYIKFDGLPLNYTNWGDKHPKKKINTVLGLRSPLKAGKDRKLYRYYFRTTTIHCCIKFQM